MRRLAAVLLVLALAVGALPTHADNESEKDDLSACSNYVINGSFGYYERMYGWYHFATDGTTIVGDYPYYFDPPYSIRLGNRNNANDWLWQPIYIPSNATSIALSFAFRSESLDTWPSSDFFYAGITDSSGAYWLEPPWVMHNRSSWTNNGWWTYTPPSYYYPAYAGTYVNVVFIQTTDVLYSTATFVDAIGLVVCTSSMPSATPTRTSTRTPTRTPTSTATATDTATLTGTATATRTHTSTPSATATATATVTASQTSTRTRTPTRTPTEPTSTPTSTPTETSTATPTYAPTDTTTTTPTLTLTTTPSVTPTPESTTSTATATGTSTASSTPTASTCAADPFEPDDSPAQARAISIVGNPQEHNHAISQDEDWVKFSAFPDYLYSIYTLDLDGQNNDTVLELFASDGTTMLAANDDDPLVGGPSSRIDWSFSTLGTYYVRARQLRGDEVWGCDIRYRMRLERGGLAPTRTATQSPPGSTPTPTRTATPTDTPTPTPRRVLLPIIVQEMLVYGGSKDAR